MKIKPAIFIQYIFFFGLGLFLVWLTIKDIDAARWAQIKTSLQHANYWIAVPVFVILIGSHYIRALRWRLLIESSGHLPDKGNTFFAVMIGYLANQALPRLGEIIKCTMLGRYEKIPVEKLVGTIILERMIDALCMVILFGVTLVIQPGLYTEISDAFFNNKQVAPKDKMPAYVLMLLILAGIILVTGLWMLIKKKTIVDLKKTIRLVVNRTWEGISAVQHLKKRGQFLGFTALIWGGYILSGYIGFYALQETSHYGIREALTILSAGSIGMILTPGGIGAYPYLIEQTMMLYGLQQPIAIAFGWLLWLAQTVIVLVAGIACFLFMPFYNRNRIQEETPET